MFCNYLRQVTRQDKRLKKKRGYLQSLALHLHQATRENKPHSVHECKNNDLAIYNTVWSKHAKASELTSKLPQ